MSDTTDGTLHARTLAKPLIKGWTELEPGDVVELRQDQIERLESEGYFEPEGTAKEKRK